jgi:hypothetical protein
MGLFGIVENRRAQAALPPSSARRDVPETKVSRFGVGELEDRQSIEEDLA